MWNYRGSWHGERLCYLLPEELEGKNARWQWKCARSVCIESVQKGFKVIPVFFVLGEISYNPEWIASLQRHALLARGKERGNPAFYRGP